MNLQDSVQKTIDSFEKNAPIQDITKLDEINKLFEDMVSKGLISRPSYNLASNFIINFSLQ